jgi:hypothetical protein
MIRRRQLDVYSAKPLKRPTSVKGYSFARLNEVHFEESEFCKPRLDLFRSRLAEGFEAHGLVTPEGQLAYYMWLSFGNDKGWAPWAFTARISLSASSGYIFDCKTDPEHRRRGLYTSALKHARWLCYRAHCNEVLIDVEPLNNPAVRAIKSASFAKRARLEVTKMGPITKVNRESDVRFSLGRYYYEF